MQDICFVFSKLKYGENRVILIGNEGTIVIPNSLNLLRDHSDQFIHLIDVHC